MIRRRFIRSAVRTRWVSVTSPARRPVASRSLEPSRASIATIRGCRSGSSCRCSSYSRSMVANRSSGANSLARARIRVVFPAFCSPVTMMFLPARSAARRKRGQARIDGAQPDQVVQVDVADPVPADHHLRPRRRPGHRRQPGPVVQAHVQGRGGGGEGPLVADRARGEELQQLDQLGVGVGHRRARRLAAVGVGDPHLVAAVDLDVLDARVVDQRLQPAQPEQGRHHRVRDANAPVLPTRPAPRRRSGPAPARPGRWSAGGGPARGAPPATTPDGAAAPSPARPPPRCAPPGPGRGRPGPPGRCHRGDRLAGTRRRVDAVDASTGRVDRPGGRSRHLSARARPGGPRSAGPMGHRTGCHPRATSRVATAASSTPAGGVRARATGPRPVSRSGASGAGCRRRPVAAALAERSNADWVNRHRGAAPSESTAAASGSQAISAATSRPTARATSRLGYGRPGPDDDRTDPQPRPRTRCQGPEPGRDVPGRGHRRQRRPAHHQRHVRVLDHVGHGVGLARRQPAGPGRRSRRCRRRPGHRSPGAAPERPSGPATGSVSPSRTARRPDSSNASGCGIT